MMFATHVSRWLPRRRPVRLGALRRRLAAALAIVAIATGGVSTPRPAAATTAIEVVMGVVVVSILAAVAIPRLIDLAGNAQEVLDAGLSCPVFAGSGTILAQDECVWAKAAGQWTTQAGTTDSTAGLRIGGQKEVAPDWFLGGAFGAASRRTQNGSGTNGAGHVFDGSVALKHTIGPWLFAGALAFSTSTMYLAPAGSGLYGDSTTYSGGMRVRGAYDFAFSGWYLQPRLDLDLIHSWRPGFMLSGPGPAGLGLTGLSVGGFSKTSVVATPMVELGGRYDIDERTVVRPYVAVGASFLPDNGSTATASLTGPLAALGSFQSSSSGPSVLANVEAGLQLYSKHGLEVKAEYRLAVGNDYLSQGASLRGAWHF